MRAGLEVVMVTSDSPPTSIGPAREQEPTSIYPSEGMNEEETPEGRCEHWGLQHDRTDSPLPDRTGVSGFPWT